MAPVSLEPAQHREREEQKLLAKAERERRGWKSGFFLGEEKRAMHAISTSSHIDDGGGVTWRAKNGGEKPSKAVAFVLCMSATV